MSFTLLTFLYTSLFYKQEMELSLVGLQNAGKTSLVNAIAVSEVQALNLCSYFHITLSQLLHQDYLHVLLNILFFVIHQTGGYSEDMIPTVGLYLAG